MSIYFLFVEFYRTICLSSQSIFDTLSSSKILS